MGACGKPKLALITGGLGQDGRLLACRLRAAGYEVVVVVKPCASSAIGSLASEVYVAPTNLGDPVAVRALLERWEPDEIYHLAAAHHASQDQADHANVKSKEVMIATNFLSTRTLAFAVAEMKMRCSFVYAASSQMFTAVNDTHEIFEDSRRNPSSFYGHTKSWSTDLLCYMREEFGLRASTAILFNHESSLRKSNFVSRKISRAAAAASKGGWPRLELHNIGSRVDWCCAQDVVRALHTMGTSMNSQDYVVASGRLHSVREMLDVAFTHVGLDWDKYATYSEDSCRPALVGRPARIRDSLGWVPETSFERMVQGMVEYDLIADDHDESSGASGCQGRG